MKNSEHLFNDWALEAFAIEKVNSLQQEILKTPGETQTSSEALSQAYETLTDEQKIAFLLAGGIPSLFHYRRHSTQEMRTGSDTETGQLPVLC
jgi:hypothetical protein